MTSLVLASASPARRRLLAAAGLEPSIVVSNVDEPAVTAAARETYGELVAEDVALVLARAKAEDVADQIDDAIIIGCDSVLDLDGEIHGKPASRRAGDLSVAADARPLGRPAHRSLGH